MAESLTIGDLLYRLGYENSDEFVAALDKTLKKGEGEAKKGGAKAGKGFSDQFKATFSGAALGSFLGTTFAQMFTRAGAAVQQFAKQSIQDYAVYEQGLVQLKLAGETNLGALQERIKALSKETRVFSSIDVSQAVGQLVKAGFDTNTAFELVATGALGAASEVDAATGRFGDLGDTAVALGGILRALQLDVSQSGRVMDVLARAAQDSNLDVSDLVDIIGKVGPVANLAGLEIEDLAAMAGVLANAGMDAGSMGTSLRAALQTLINPAEGVKQQLDALGISLITSTGEMRDFDDVLAGLSDLIDQGPRGLELLTQAFGAFGGGAAANLGSLSVELAEFRRNMGDAEGSAKTLADGIRDTGHGAIAEMEARMASARVELGQQLMPVMIDMYQTVLPPLVTGLGHAITFFEALKFAVTGIDSQISRINDEIARSTQQSRETADARLGEGWFDAQQQKLTLLSDIAEVQEQLDQGGAWYTYALGYRGRDEKILAELNAELAETEALLGELEAARAELATTPAAAPPPAAAPDAAAIAATAEAYRNLAAVEAELAEARQQHSTAATAEEEAAAAERVRILEAEVKAKKAVFDTASQAATPRAAATRVEDPLVEEAGRVAADLNRLKLLRDSGRLEADEYEEWLEAHLRRLGGMWDRADNLEQKTAILRAESGFLTELEALDKKRTAAAKEEDAERLKNIEAAQAARAAALAEQARRDENQYRYEVDTGIISPEEHLAVLGILQLQEEKYSDAWMALQLEKDRTQEKIDDEAARRQAEANRAELDQLAEQSAAREKAQKEQAERDENHIQWQLKTGELGKEQYREILSIQILQYEEYSSEWMRIRLEMHDLDKELLQAEQDAAKRANQELLDQLEEDQARREAQLADQAKREANQYQHELSTGQTSPEEHLAVLQILLLQEEEYSDEWMAIQAEILKYDKQINDKRVADEKRASDERLAIIEEEQAAREAQRAAEDRIGDNQYEWQVQQGIITRDQHLENLDILLLAYEKYSDEWMNIQREIAKYQQEDYRESLKAEQERIAELISGEGRLTEAKRLALLERLQAELDAIDASVAANQAAVDAILEAQKRLRGSRGVDFVDPEEQLAQFEARMYDIVMGFPRALAAGIMDGDIAGALQSALGSATDFFLDAMLQAILGPIAEQLTASIMASVTAGSAAQAGAGAASGAAGASALGPWGLLIGAGLFLATSLVNSSQRRSQQQEQRQSSVDRTVSGAGAITYNLTANVRVQSNASWTDPAFYSRWRSETESLLTSLLGKVRKD